MHLPDLESLRCFEAAASQLNFRAAARQVALSAPAFSDRIRRLEELLGKQLFVRTTRKVELSDSGRALLGQARRVLAEAARCAEVVREGPQALPFVLTIGTRFELGLSWLTPALEPLQAERPERTLHLYFGDSDALLQRIRDGRIDAAVTSARLTSAGLNYAVLHEETYVFVASPKLVRLRPFARPADAENHTLLDLHADLPLFRYFLDAAPPSAVWGFRGKVLLGTIAAVRAQVLAGAGIAVLPRYFVEKDLSARKLSQLMPRVRLTRDFFRVVWREGHSQEAELEALARSLQRLPLR